MQNWDELPSVKTVEQSKYIFDRIRKKYVRLTPEEKVRQFFIHYLVNVHDYSPALIAVEMSIKVHKLAKRCDIVVYNRNRTPRMIVECKAEDVALTRDVFAQAAQYNLPLNVDYLVLTNHKVTYCFLLDREAEVYRQLSKIPDFSDLLEDETDA